MECWGAQGGDYSSARGGRGAYTCGIININTNSVFYLYIGSAGHSITAAQNGNWEFNGGGPAGGQAGFENKRYWSSGGGATDIRLSNGNWNDFNSLKSRIMVAAGGGGIFNENATVEHGGYGGALIGGNALIIATSYPGWGTGGSGGTQIMGGYDTETRNTNLKAGTYSHGGFGYGGYRYDYTFDKIYCASGGGGGYYGGGGSAHVHSAGGGSSFISGHTGCNAISESSTSSNIVHTGQPNHYSGKVFTNTVMKAGNESMPSPTGGTETGHSGNGYCKITWHPAL
jgi:hypothetical protein